jgi:hypothetical protein
MMGGRIVVYGLHDVRDGVIHFVSTTAGDPEQGLANYRSQSKHFRQGVFGWLREVGPENVTFKIVREIPFTEEPGSKSNAKGIALWEKGALIAHLRAEGVSVLNGKRGLSGDADKGLLDDAVRAAMRGCVEFPRLERVVGRNMSRETAKTLAITVRKEGRTVDAMRGRWYARMVQNAGGGDLWDVVASFEPYRRQRYESSKPKPKVEQPWEAGAREHLRKLGLSDDDIHFDA